MTVTNADIRRTIISMTCNSKAAHVAAGLYPMLFHHGPLSKKDIDSFFLNGTLLAGHASYFVEKNSLSPLRIKKKINQILSIEK